MDLFNKIVEGIQPLNSDSVDKAKKYVDFLAKPIGSLGKLEDIAVQLSGITGELKNTIHKKCTIVMAADNGIYEENIATTPKEVTAIQAINMVKGHAGISVISKQAGADYQIVDIGIDGNATYPGLIDRKIRKGTSNMAKGPAMSKEEAIKAINVGINMISDLVKEGYDLFGTGEMGVANTSTSSAILMSFTGCSAQEAVGKGAGLTDEGLLLKKEVIERALKINNPNPKDAIDVLSKVGGFDIAGMVGCFLGAAYHKVPIVIDGVISAAAAFTAYKINPLVREYMIPSHCSLEPAYNLIIKEMKVKPMLLMDMRLGEGTGCPLAYHIIETACSMMNNMATFDDIQVVNDYLIDIREDKAN